MEVHESGCLEGGGRASQGLLDRVGKSAGGKRFWTQHGEAAAAIRDNIMPSRDVLVHRFNLGQSLYDEGADGPFVRLAHPAKREMVRLRVERVRGTKRVVLALKLAPKEGITLQVERGLQAFRFCKRL